MRRNGRRPCRERLLVALVKALVGGPFGLGLFLAANWMAWAAPLLEEQFDQTVADNSPIGAARGWHACALYGGVVTDFTSATPGASYPSLSHSPDFAGVRGHGYLVLGAGNLVSNVLVWLDAGTNCHNRAITEISFYTKNDAAFSSERIVVEIGARWFATTAAFHDAGGGSSWSLNTFAFTTAPGAWRSLDTNSLTLGAPLAAPLPCGEIRAVGIFGSSGGAAKIRLDDFQVLAGPQMDPEYLVGSWIWDQRTSVRQTCRFWKIIEIPRGASVSKGRLRLTADNSYRAFFDGMEFGRGSEWRRLTEYDLTLVLTPGTHVLAVEAFNEWGWAGLVGGLTVELGDGRSLAIPSDETWRIVPGEEGGWRTRKTPGADWPKARALYRFSDLPELPTRPQVLFPAALQPRVVRFWQSGWFQLLLLAFCGLAALLCLRLLAQLAVQSQAQQVLQRERARIARDIHDDFGAGLTQLVLLGETAQSESRLEPATRAQFVQVSEAGRRLLRSIDEVVWMINSQRDSLQDFETYVCRYAENFLRLSSLRCRLDVDAEIPQVAFDLPTRRSVFLAIKEALTNAVRHGGASEVKLSIHVADLQVRVAVADDGRGFDPAGTDRRGNGLANMAQRLAEVGGSCRVFSQPGAGCRVELAAPLRPEAHRRRRWFGWRPRHESPPSQTRERLL